MLGYLAGVGAYPGRLLHLGQAFAGSGHWLPRQAPLALILAAGEAWLAWWLRWLHTGEQDFPAPRPGLIVAVRRQFTARRIAAGGVGRPDRDLPRCGLADRAARRGAVDRG